MDEATLREHHAFVKGEPVWRARLRLLQSLWRQDRGYEAIDWKPEAGLPYLGSRLPEAWATESGANFLTEDAFERVRSELAANAPRPTAERALISTPRIFNDLLSSQPLAFNLFAPLDADRAVASKVFRGLFPDRVRDVTRIEFEWSPGRGNAEYLENRSAFDVYVEHTVPGGGEGFIGIEVKYHEDLSGTSGELRSVARDVAEWAGLVEDIDDPQWHRNPHNQLLLDHLLALSMLRKESETRSGMFVFLYPVANLACRRAVASYESAIHDPRSTFKGSTLEEVVGALRLADAGVWVDDFHRRYLAYPA